jgi:hypothetical protein
MMLVGNLLTPNDRHVDHRLAKASCMLLVRLRNFRDETSTTYNFQGLRANAASLGLCLQVYKPLWDSL